jgi:hypothetical protein
VALVALPPCTLAEELGQEKENAPAVVRYAIANDPLDRSTWRDADDFAQGERICFAVVGSLPEDVDRMRDLSYRLVAELASGHTYVEGSATVWLVGMDGSARDVTNNLAVVNPLRPSVTHEFSRPVLAGDAAPGKAGPSQARAALRQGRRLGHAHVPRTRTPDGVRASSSRPGKLTRQLLYRH